MAASSATLFGRSGHRPRATSNLYLKTVPCRPCQGSDLTCYAPFYGLFIGVSPRLCLLLAPLLIYCQLDLACLTLFPTFLHA